MNSPRLFNCRKCTKQVVICSHCDRGNIYCSNVCANQSRINNHRLSNQLYQRTYRGKLLHALRQKHYRARQKEKVTDQCSTEAPINDLLPELKNEKKCRLKNIVRCDFCHTRVSHFFRNGYLMHFRNKNLMLKNSRNGQGP